MQQLEGSGHLLCIKIPLLRHHILEKRNLAGRHEQHQFTGVG